MAISLILVFRGVQWDPGAFAAHSLTPYDHPSAPTSNVYPKNRRVRYGRRKNPCARRYVKGKWEYTSGFYLYLGVPWGVSGISICANSPHMAAH